MVLAILFSILAFKTGYDGLGVVGVVWSVWLAVWNCIKLIAVASK